jgi:regulator of protease activity HflC (stomatin/prohibitin superfamily)
MSWSLGFIVCVIILKVIFSCAFVVRGKQAAILETLGKPHRTAKLAGLHWKMPWPITIIRSHIKLQLFELAHNISVKTRDNAFVTLPVKVQYRASSEPEGAVKAYYELYDPKEQIASYVLKDVRQTAAGMDMEALYDSRDELEHKVIEMLRDRFDNLGYIVENVLIDQPQPSEEVRNSFNRVIASVRLREAAQNEAEAEKSRILGRARAEAESKRLQGEGMAQMREAVAKGLEASMKTIIDAGLAPSEAIAFLTDTNRLDTISQAAMHHNLIIIDSRQGSDLARTVAAVKAAAPRTLQLTADMEVEKG